MLACGVRKLFIDSYIINILSDTVNFNKLKKMLAPYANILLMVGLFSSFLASVSFAQVPPITLTTTLCTVATEVFQVIFILGLMLMIIGAAMYAAAHILPGQQKGALTGYGMGMIIGGVVGVVLALMAGPIMNIILQASGSNVLGTATLSSCPLVSGGIGAL